MNSFTHVLLAHVESGGSGSSNLWYFLVAYVALWGLVFGYLYYLHGRMKELEGELDNHRPDPLSRNEGTEPAEPDE